MFIPEELAQHESKQEKKLSKREREIAIFALKAIFELKLERKGTIDPIVGYASVVKRLAGSALVDLGETP